MNGTDAVDTGAQGESRHQLVVGPNAALTGIQATLFMLWMCVLSFGIAGVLAWRGYWLVFPFAGLEMLALAAGLWWSLRGNVYREVIILSPDRILIEAGRRRPEHRWDFPRAWSRLQFEPESPADHSHLWLTYAGARCEIGACLGEDDRAALARRIRELLARPAFGPASNND
ncbi:MAG: DUF2244 domain-containing protein [Nevskiales bacterium]